LGTQDGPELPSAAPAAAATAAPVTYRERRFRELLFDSEVVNLEELKKLSWSGVPSKWRPMVWQLLLAYLPSDRKRREATLTRKRKEYADAVPAFFDVPSASRTMQEQKMLRQILVDVPRTSPDVPLFHQAVIQRCMERLLYIWSIRHPASGYVQGMNDLATPLFVVFLSAAVERSSASVEAMDAARLSKEALTNVEADTYWCLTKLLDNIQDHYTAGQPGLQRQIFRLEELTRRIDSDLHLHLQNEGIVFSFFAFRWMNNLLMRELPLQAIIRLWDTLFSEDESGCGFEDFHVFVCAAFLKSFSSKIQTLAGEELMCFLQAFPTREWGGTEVETLLSEAFILSTLYRNSPSHLAHDPSSPGALL